MKHCRYSRLLSSFSDHKLDPRQERQLEEHLPLCYTCSKELDELITLRQLCAGLTEEELPLGLHQQILNRVQKPAPMRRKTVWIQRVAVPLAAAFLVLLIAKGSPGLWSNMDRAEYAKFENENVAMATRVADPTDGIVTHGVEGVTDQPDKGTGEESKHLSPENGILAPHQYSAGGNREENPETNAPSALSGNEPLPASTDRIQYTNELNDSIKDSPLIWYGAGTAGILILALTMIHIWRRRR